jgi:hypothetical protein
MQKEFLKSCERFLRAALFNPFMEFEKILGHMTSFEVI